MTPFRIFPVLVFLLLPLISASATEPPAPLEPLPSANQLAWQEK